jgi:crotonobetainyl-CoA:carnitine CoA-transferase CaiB-like acyl-CoA transferase
MASAAAGSVPDLADDLAAAFRQRPAREWVTELSNYGVAVGPVTEVQSDSWLAEQGLLRPDAHPAFRDFWRLPSKIDFADEEFQPGPAAALGEHSRALLEEIGYTPQQISELVDAGTLGVWQASHAEAAAQ